MKHTTIVSLFFLLLIQCQRHNDTAAAVAQKGVVDLRNWDFESGTPVDLIGEWEMYWNMLLLPADFHIPSPLQTGKFVNISDNWKRQNSDDTSQSEFGCVTYRLTILLPPIDIPIALQVGRVMTSYKLWKNGLLIAEAGTPGTSPETTTPKIKPQIVSFYEKSDSLEIILQIANFDFDHGGITGFERFGTLKIGAADALFRKHLKSIAFDFILSGAFIVMALFHFALFLLGKYGKSLIYLGTICLLMLLYLAREYLLFHFFPDLSFGIYSRLINIPVFMLCGVFLLFFYSLYPEETDKRTVSILTIGSLIYSTLVLSLPQHFSEFVYSCYVPYMLVLICFMMNIIIRAALHHRNSAIYIFLASCVVALSAVNDICNGFGIIKTGYMLPVGGFSFITMCELGIYDRFVRAEQFELNQKEKLVETEKLASLGTLIAGVAHEINNPNNSILISSQQQFDIWNHLSPVIDDCIDDDTTIRIGSLGWKELRKEIPEAFERITRNARRIERIVTDLKTYARKDISNSMEPVDINMVVRGSITLLENTLKNSTDSFIVDYAEYIPPIEGSFQKLEQVVINLIVNACQSLKSRNASVHVETAYEPEKHHAILIISDEGCGIEPTILRHVFVPFFTTKQNEGGTGLGLSIAQSIIAGHNGELKISSEVGIGTRVIINFPTMEVPPSGNAS